MEDTRLDLGGCTGEGRGREIREQLYMNMKDAQGDKPVALGLHSPFGRERFQVGDIGRAWGKG